MKELDVIGNNTEVEIGGISHVPAKIDTGADSSCVWASGLKIREDGKLEFALFGPESELYTGERLVAEEYEVRQVRSSNGAVQIRYVVPLTMTMRGRRIKAKFTLASRATNKFPVLIGRKTLAGKFLVDVKQGAVRRKATFDNANLNAELRKDPRAFHEKYMK